MSTQPKTIDDITRTKTSLDQTERIPGRDSSGDFKITIQNLVASIINPVAVTEITANYDILDDDNFGRFEVDTTSGDITIKLPLKSNNLGREIEISHIAGTNKIIIQPHATDTNTLTNDALGVMWLPKIGNHIKFKESQNSGYWEVLSEAITSQLRLNTYAGYGSTDNKIMRFTNSVENVGNMFSENHSTGYSSNAKGLEITINRSGNYAFMFQHRSSASNAYYGLSLNSNRLTTDIISITRADALSYDFSAADTIKVHSINMYFKKNDVIRYHTQGVVPAIPAQCSMLASYLGN